MPLNSIGLTPSLRPCSFGMLLAATVLLSSAHALRADTLTLTPAKDNTIYLLDGNQTRSNGVGCSIFAGTSGGGRLQRALLEFNVSSIPAGSIVSSARLILNMNKTPSGAGNFTLKLHRVLAEWGEAGSNAGCGSSGPNGGGTGAIPLTGDASWFHAFHQTVPWTTLGGDFAATPSASLSVGAIGVYTWGSNPQLVADVQAWVNSAAANHGWILIGGETGVPSSKRFDSREASSPSVRPKLEITYAQAPACALRGDVNNNAVFNSKDIQAFTNCLTNHLSGGEDCDCADVNCDNLVNFSDVSRFVQCVLSATGSCPCP